ncbi:MAG: hypothetical protein RQ936_02650 [Gammaproteobacteria bacterium]|nr:hypothetical protein [Gammaproteobacteria bacterium]
MSNIEPGISAAGNTMKSVLLLSIFISGILSATLVHAEIGAGLQRSESREWKLAEEQWDLVKQGEQLLKMPMMHEVVEVWSLRQGRVIELRYPGGEEGELWVEELMDWLISLGIASQYLLAVPGSGEADVIMIKILKIGDISR